MRVYWGALPQLTWTAMAMTLASLLGLVAGGLTQPRQGARPSPLSGPPRAPSMAAKS
jgi:hypothetical protein